MGWGERQCTFQAGVLVGKSILALKAGLLPALEQFRHGFKDLTTSKKRGSGAPLGNQLQPSR